jgi:hypothetical protein
MQAAFGGIARILFEAGILTLELLNNELRLLVLESAISGGWWYAPIDTREEIFPGYQGHREEWDELCEQWHGLFAAETAEWHSKLLEKRAADTGSANLVEAISGPASEIKRHGKQQPIYGAAAENSSLARSRKRRDGDPIAEERSGILDAFKARARSQGIIVTDEMVAKAAKKTWNDRTMVTWWKRNDPNCKLPHDRLIRAVLARDPALIWPPKQ